MNSYDNGVYTRTSEARATMVSDKVTDKIVKWHAPLVVVLGGIPLESENDGQVLLTPPVGFAGQQPLVPSDATLPKALESFQPFHWSQSTDL